jgi:hypothetical protein
VSPSHEESACPKPAEQPPETDATAALDEEVQQAIAVCDGDVMQALRITLIANAFLEAEIDRLTAQISTGFARGRVRGRAT